MALSNFLRGVIAQVNPFDSGKTYGSYNPPKKKKNDQDQGGSGSSAAPQSSQQNPSQPQVQAQRPENVFAGIHNDLRLPGSTPPSVQVNKNPDLSVLTNPKPGTVITPNQPSKPTNTPPPAPAQSQKVQKDGMTGQMINNHFVPDAPKPQSNGIFNKIGNTVKTAGETAIGTVANVPEVGLAAARAGSGLVQGITQLPHIATAIAATGTQKLDQALPSPFTHALNTGLQAANTGVKQATDVVNKPFDVLNRGLDTAANKYADVNPFPGADAGLQIYKKEQIPLNILAGLATLGGSTAGEAGAEAGNASRLTQLLTKPLSSNPDNVIAKTGGFVSDKSAPVINALNNPFAAAKNAIGELLTGRSVPHPSIDQHAAGDAEGAAIRVGKEATHVPVGSNIEVNAPPSEPTGIPVRNTTPTGQPIRELGGDTPGAVHIPTQEEAAAQQAARRFQNQDFPVPDQRIEGVTPTDTGITSPNFTRAQLDQEQRNLDESLASGEINAGTHKAASDVVQKIPAVDEAPKGQRIQVKQVDSIPLQDQTTVPTGLPETPGQVRATTQTAPTNAETQAVANAPVVATPAELPKEVQNILDNPKQFNKRQVAAARNQRTLARQTAKANEGTAEAMGRIETASPAATSPEGFQSTGEFGNSANGGSYEKVGRAAEMKQAQQETSQMSPGDVVKTARENQAQTGSFNRRDIRNIQAMFEGKRIPRGTPEYNEARAIMKEDGTHQAQSLALRGGNTVRRTATSDQLTGQFESKLYRMVDDPTKIDSGAFDQVDAAETKFTQARDDALGAYNRFTEAPTRANAKAYHAAQDAADSADKEAKMTEFKVAQTVLKGNKDIQQVRELNKMAENADLYQMDAVDASMLSGTGTFSRNFVNSLVGGGEEGLFGGVASRAANLITGENVGGGVGKGTISGFKKGVGNIVDASKARASNAGKNPLEHLKNWSTTGNQLGDSVIDSQINHNVIDHYTQLLRDQGYKGRELADRAGVMARQDPDEVGKVYAGYARAAAGLGSGITKSSKVETVIRDGISNFISGGNPNQVSEITAKLLTRMTVGFPSAVGRTVIEGGKRAALGAPTALKLFTKAARDDPAVRAQIIKESIKQAGTGATVGTIFYGLGKAGLVTGAYPADKAERARWQREGISENSIKIGDNYYQLPSYLGSAAIPALFSATLGRNNGDVAKSVGEVAKGLPAILPTDQASNVLDFINGKTDAGKFITQTGASAVRAVTPAGALLNQIAKSFDPTQNDTSSGSNLSNFVDKVLSGIPGENKFANIPDKTDAAGNVLHNPGAVPLAFGASSTTQDKGVQETKDQNAQTNSDLKAISDTGAFDDPNIQKVLTDDKTKKIYNDIKAGKQVSPEDAKKLQEAMVKGVSDTGSDTAFLEREQYGSNIAALTIKRGLMAADPTTKPSDLKKMDTAIKRGKVYQGNKIPYDEIQSYESTSLSDWRAMGNPKSDSYDPEAYQKLWDIDQKMTKAGVSYKKGDPAKNKYSAKESGSGGAGSRGGSSFSSDFGTLKAGTGAPRVQSYETLDQSSGSVPVIPVVRPNIVHKIGSSG